MCFVFVLPVCLADVAVVKLAFAMVKCVWFWELCVCVCGSSGFV